MRLMILIKPTKDTEARVLADKKLLTEMGKYNEELEKIGVMLTGEGAIRKPRTRPSPGLPGMTLYFGANFDYGTIDSNLHTPDINPQFPVLPD